MRAKEGLNLLSLIFSIVNSDG